MHATLAVGLRAKGHDVTVVSNGDFWKNYPRDIDVSRRPGKTGGLALLYKIKHLLPQLRGYDVVQLINPLFFELKAQRLFSIYHNLREHNDKLFLGAFGMDWYWVTGCRQRKHLRYSDFNIGDTLRDDPSAQREIDDWCGTDKERLNRQIAEDCDGIVAGLYEYWSCYAPLFPEKTTFIPFPIICQPPPPKLTPIPERVKVFIGINRSRSAYKGTDIMLKEAQRVAMEHPETMQLEVAESVPFAQYQAMLEAGKINIDLGNYIPDISEAEALMGTINAQAQEVSSVVITLENLLMSSSLEASLILSMVTGLIKELVGVGKFGIKRKYLTDRKVSNIGICTIHHFMVILFTRGLLVSL